MTLDAGRKLPKYQQIAHSLRSSIKDGAYPDGSQLPGTRELAARFAVADMTVRQAIGILRAEGLIDSRGGAGHFVRSFAPIRRHGIQRLARDRWGSGASIWSDEKRDLVVDQLVVQENVVAPENVAADLELRDGETACLRSRRFVIADRPVLLSRSFLPQALVAGSQITQSDTGPGGTYARLGELGAAPVHYREELRVRQPDAEEAERLGLAIGAPVIQLVRTAWAEGQRPVEVNEMVLDATAYILDYEFDAP